MPGKLQLRDAPARSPVMAFPVNASPPAETPPRKKTERGIEVWPLPCQFPISRPPSDAYDRMLVLTVGKPRILVPPKTFQIYRGVLCHYSDYFKTMLSSGFKEGGSENLVLDAVEPEVFQMFYDFMNTGDISLNKIPLWTTIIEAYIFADFRLAQGFKNKVIDFYFATIARAWVMPSRLTASLVYDHTSEQSPLRKFQVDFHTTFCSTEGLRQNTDPKAFLWDLLKAYEEGKKVPGFAPTGFERGMCVANMTSTFCKNYHDHNVVRARPVTRQVNEPKTVQKRDVGTAFGSDVVQGREESAE